MFAKINALKVTVLNSHEENNSDNLDMTALQVEIALLKTILQDTEVLSSSK